ncbi:hypothetical protein [Halotia branconii]|uniref:Uncharacterized protein n=1 Tax=Halotia branconii CENA392 TaxID=1539056 RepID=A0AAJ6P9Z8_9CYAN|nr:hypothetical protein [Halotia branconii]WGV26217.1 hypothetical protein QI031_01495 [Halotia branconii CENA392]
MQPTITIPRNWAYPRFPLGQQTKQGLIVGIEYLTKEHRGSWRYAVLNSQNAEELNYLAEDDIQLFLPK